MTENRTTEIRREYTDSIKYTVVAFANTEGGRIYIGIKGVENMVATMRSITGMLQDAIRPDISAFAECTVETVDGRPAVVLAVQRGTARPYYLTEKGIQPQGVYLRQGASSVPASETAILEMIKETGGDHYENARSLDQKLTFTKAERYFQKKDLPFGEQQKRELNIIGADGTYTNLGMLLSDQCIHTLKLAVFEGSRKNVSRARKELSGSLLTQLEEAYSYLDRLNHTRGEAGGAGRGERRDYPAEALREALLNALIHRDYSFRSPTLVNVFDDRVEVVTIGGLVHGLTFEDITLGVSAPRNRDLANVFYRLGLIEAQGAGILKMHESFAGCAAKPQFEVTGNAFKVTLPNRNHPNHTGPVSHMSHPNRAAHPVHAGERRQEIRAALSTASKAPEKTDRQKELLRLAEQQGSIIRKDVESQLKVSQATAILILRDMVESGLLIKEGTGKEQKYRAAGE